MVSISRILSLLAGAFLGAALSRRKEGPQSDGAPWREELEELQKKFTEQLSAHDIRLDNFRQEFEGMVTEAAARPDTAVAGLTARLAELQPKIEAMARQLTAKPDGRIDELAARISQLQPKIEALAMELKPKPDPRVDQLVARVSAVESKTASLQETVNAHDQKLQAATKMVIGIEQMLSAKMAEFDRRLEAQGRMLEAMNSSIAQSDELLERVLDLVQTMPTATGEPREPVTIVAGGSEVRESQL